MQLYIVKIILCIIVMQFVGCRVSNVQMYGEKLNIIVEDLIENQTTKSGIENALLFILKEELTLSGYSSFTYNEDQTMLLDLKITDYENTPTAYDNNYNILQYSLFMSVSITLTDLSDQDILYTDDIYSSHIYNTGDFIEKDVQSVLFSNLSKIISHRISIKFTDYPRNEL